MRRFIVSCLALGICTLVACESSNDTAEKETVDVHQHPKSVIETNRNKPLFEKSFEPIHTTSKKKLEQYYTKDELEYTPKYEVAGQKKKRSVPLGQTLLEDKQDESNGPLKNHRLVAYYGTPQSENMGILGEYEPEEMMAKLKKQTKAYSDLDPERPAIPTIELIATVAQRTPGKEGLYITPPNKKVIERYSKLAKENNAILMLDVQLGRADVMHAVKEIAPFLKEEHVHLAIDTEYSVDEGQIPGEDLGHVDGADVQEAVEYVDKLVKQHNLPDKMVLVHQFGNGIVQNKEEIKPTQHVQVPLNYDGFGDAAIKLNAYGTIVKDQPIQYGGFKVFHKNDKPVLQPKDVLKLDPSPAIVNYQ